MFWDRRETRQATFVSRVLTSSKTSGSEWDIAHVGGGAGVAVGPWQRRADAPPLRAFRYSWTLQVFRFSCFILFWLFVVLTDDDSFYCFSSRQKISGEFSVVVLGSSSRGKRLPNLCLVSKMWFTELLDVSYFTKRGHRIFLYLNNVT